MSGTGEDGGNVAGKELDSHGQQDDTEELAEHVDDVGSEPMGDFVEVAQDKVVDDDVDGQANHDVDGGVFGAQRDEGRDGAWTRDEWEGDRHDAGARGGGLVLDNVASENHLESKDEEHHGAGHGERRHVDAEESQQGLADDKEAHKEQQGSDGGMQGLDGGAFVAHGDEDGDGARDVDDSEHDEEGAENLNDADGL